MTPLVQAVPLAERPAARPLWRRLMGTPGGIIGLMLVAVLVLAALACAL